MRYIYLIIQVAGIISSSSLTTFWLLSYFSSLSSSFSSLLVSFLTGLVPLSYSLIIISYIFILRCHILILIVIPSLSSLVFSWLASYLFYQCVEDSYTFALLFKILIWFTQTKFLNDIMIYINLIVQGFRHMYTIRMKGDMKYND